MENRNTKKVFQSKDSKFSFKSVTEKETLVIALFNFEGTARYLDRKETSKASKKNGGVAQLGEHLLCKQGVIGSNPFISTNTGS